MSDHIPIDLWAKILLNLPVKSLVQCTSVCKKWHSLITSSSFVDTHLSSSLHRQRHHPSQLLLTPTIEEDHQSLYFEIEDQKCYFVTFQTDPPEPTQNFQRPFPSRTKNHEDTILFYRVVGSLHGLVCLSDDTIYGYTEVIILWNPLIHKSLQLPWPQFIFDTLGTYAMMLGFGFDSGKNDYKVVRIVYQQRMGKNLLPPLVEVYSINEGSWRTVNADYVQYCIWERAWSQCFIHGALHWVAHDKNKLGLGCFENVILLFDVGTEEFSTMLLPESLVYAAARTLSVAVIGGLLSVLHECSSIWVQREYGEVSSWTKIFNLEKSIDLGMAIQCRKYVETLLKSSVGEMACDCKDLQLPNMYKLPTRVDGFYVFSYPETLLMLDKQRWFKVHPRSNKMTVDGPKKSGKKLEAGPGEVKIDSCSELAMSEALEGEENALEEEEEEGSDSTDSSEESVENHD